MKNHSQVLRLVALIVSLFPFALHVPAVLAQEKPIRVRAMGEELGDEALAAANYYSALDNYRVTWAGLQSSADSPARQLRLEALAAKMAKASVKGDAPSTETSEFHSQKGQAFFKLAKSPADFEKAVQEFEMAVSGPSIGGPGAKIYSVVGGAPWVFEYHFNLATAYKSAGQLNKALGSSKIATILALSDKDRRDALALRAQIEAAIEIRVSQARGQ